MGWNAVCAGSQILSIFKSVNFFQDETTPHVIASNYQANLKKIVMTSCFVAF